MSSVPKHTSTKTSVPTKTPMCSTWGTHSEKTKASLYTTLPLSLLLTHPNELRVAMPPMLVLVQEDFPPTHMRMP
jgi:hypothetical protein